TLGHLLPVEVRHLLEEVHVVQQQRAVRTHRERVAVAGRGRTPSGGRTGRRRFRGGRGGRGRADRFGASGGHGGLPSWRRAPATGSADDAPTADLPAGPEGQTSSSGPGRAAGPEGPAPLVAGQRPPRSRLATFLRCDSA